MPPLRLWKIPPKTAGFCWRRGERFVRSTQCDGIARSRHLICVRSSRRAAERVSDRLRIPPLRLWKIPPKTAGFCWRRRRDSNPRTACDGYTISSRAPSTKLGDSSVLLCLRSAIELSGWQLDDAENKTAMSNCRSEACFPRKPNDSDYILSSAF